MSKIGLTEGNLKRVIREVLSESVLLSEGYSGKYFDEQIREIVQQFMEYKTIVDNGRHQMIRNVPQTYTIRVSLRPFFTEDESVDKDYLVDKDYKVRISYTRQDGGDFVKGGFNPLSLSRPGAVNITIRFPRNGTEDGLYSTLTHEVTHLVDDLIKTAKGHNSHSYPYLSMKLAGLPRYAYYLLYHLWSNTEFNAWQTNIRYAAKDVDFAEWLMDNLKQAYESNNEEEWYKIRAYVALTATNLPILNKSISAFKDYFIKTSFKLIKKMVKKYY